ncbi:E3 ubiquitin-protein ligase RFWD3-like isoform X2 [Artemia franciscana]|uniref:RING-type E3 ubiquitin transferase n=1 Tax=Artemia franciscana TaxID=6661 RepID=A0AA88HNQ9_ARTSF|nr:hypothetical protein QYM36_014608 [Artemia franciscana]
MSNEERSPLRQRRRVDTDATSDIEVQEPEVFTSIIPFVADEGKDTIEQGSEHDEPDSDEETVCSICFEPWTTAGSHRVACLACGHLYGKKCIEKWIASAGKNAVCPQCKSKARKQDIRPLFVRNLKALDNTELERTQQTLEKTREELRKTELAHANALALLRTRESEIQKLNTRITLLKESLGRGEGSIVDANNEFDAAKRWDITLERNVEVNKDGGCRLLAYDGQRILVTSQPASQNRLFKGYGIRKICSVTLVPSKFHPLHEKPITDMAFNPEKYDQFLSVSTDKYVKITDMQRNVEVFKVLLDYPLTSAAWCTENSNQFYVGTSLGHISLYDLRKLDKEAVEKITQNEPTITSPVYGLAHVSKAKRSGLLALRLKQFSFYEFQEETKTQCLLSDDDLFNCLSYEPSTHSVLITTKPSSKHPNVRHFVYSPNEDGAPFSPSVTISGSSKMRFLSQSTMFLNPGGKLTVGSSLETANCVALWDCNGGKLSYTLPLRDGACDLLSFYSNNDLFLGAIGEQSLSVFKWHELT